MRGITWALPLLLLASSCALGAGVPPARTPPSAAPAPAVEADVTTTTAVAASTTTTSTTTTTTTAPKQRIVVRGTGDVNLDPDYTTGLRANGYAHAWSGLEGLFAEDDLTIVNLECSPSPLGTPAWKQFVFRCPDGLDEMRDAGVDVANLANNHGQDYGKEAMLDGRRRLLDAGILPVGVGDDVAQANAPAIVEVGGWTIAVVGLGGVVPDPGWFATETSPGMSDGDDVESMVAAVRRADELADLVFVTIHWGVELDTRPRQEDVERARAMIAAGADGIFGHHSHRLNPLEYVDGVPVAWGLGNFVWPRQSDASATTAVAEIVVEPDGSTSARLIPAFIVESGHPVLVDR